MNCSVMTIGLLAVSISCCASAAPVRLDVKPGESLEAVRDKVRALPPADRAKGVEIVLAPGVYELRQPLKLDKQDGGAFRRPVVWRAEKPGTASLRGAVTVPKSAFGPVTDAAVKARLPEGVRDRVRQASIKESFGTLPKAWGDAFTESPGAPSAYYDGRPMTLARWPNEGASDLSGPEPQDKGWCWFTNAVDTGVNADLPGPEREKGLRPGAFRFADPRARRWNLAEGVWMYGYWVHDWYAVYQRVASYDPTTQVLRFAKPITFGIGGRTAGGNKRRFYVLNLPEELDAPLEWWFDRKTGNFYWLPPEKDAEGDVVVAVDAPLLAVSGAEHLRFEGIDFAFSHAKDPAVDVRDAAHVVFAHCSFRNHSSLGLRFERGRDCRAEDCAFRGFGAGAVQMNGGDRRWLVPARHALVRCDVSDYARTLRQAFPVRMSGCGCAVRACKIHDGPCGAVSYMGNDHFIGYNEFTRVMLEACDAGALYTGRDSSTQGHLVFANTLHHLGLEPELARFRSGFYFDDCDWGDAVIGNRVEGIGIGLHVGGGSMHPVMNNLFVDCDRGVLMGSRGWSWKRAWRGSFAVDPKTGLGWAESLCAKFDYRSAPWSVAYPDLPKCLDENPELPHLNVYSNNVFVACKQPFSFGEIERTTRYNGPVPTAMNTILSDAAKAPTDAYRPVEIEDAPTLDVVSPDRSVVARFGLDVLARMSWIVLRNGRSAVERSTLGVTVDGRDYGRLTVPGEVTRCEGSGNFFTNCWSMLKSGAEKEEKSFSVGAWKGGALALRDLVSGQTVAQIEVRVWNGGVAYRWCVPGKGARFVTGEMNTWDVASGAAVRLMEADRTEAWPEFYPQMRTPTVKGVVFPERPRGFAWKDEVVTPWRLTVFD